MVCQAAPQTRFRASKHENGIAGSSTIIIRIIAYFQALQDCQVANFSSSMGDDSRWRQFGNLIVFRTYNNVNATPPFPRIADRRFLLLNPTSIPPPISSGPAAVAAQKRFLVFDQSINRTTEPMSSCSRINLCSVSPPFTNEAKVSNDEMHEDTEEIDALLDSDSENYREEEASTGNSPFETVTSENTANVAAKRRRLSYADLDDTASSAHTHEEAECGLEHQSKRRRRERIEETVGALRRIVPFGRRRKGNGDEVAAVIDDAIRYLRSLKAEGQRVG